MRIAALRAAAEVPGAARILQRNVYGWFARIERGTYTLSDGGGAAMTRFACAIAALPAVREVLGVRPSEPAVRTDALPLPRGPLQLPMR